MILRKSNDRSRDIDLGPSPVVGPSWLRGVIVTGEPSKPSKGAGLTPNQMKPDTRPVVPGRPRLPVYGSEAERIEARRASWRASKRRARDQAA